MAGKPTWRRGVDAVEGALSPVAGHVVRNETFALSVAVVARTRRGLAARAERMSRQGLHLLNLPAGSDINRLLRSIASLEREVRELAKQLETPARSGHVVVEPH
ncbi:hypothetical protein [Sporichthya polymorpha]|uniref:hypothetical protein n=1 Tax=Sporichthya polymorpha TaxID=35751 RepID=UPI0012EC29DD|nr:hypothetical protein [Sporichthya polymorpha]